MKLDAGVAEADDIRRAVAVRIDHSRGCRS
jgi:hypothetical protein